MSDLDPIRQRLKLMLRAEQAFGVSGIVSMPIVIDTAAAVIEKPRAAPLVEPPPAATVTEVEQNDLPRGTEFGPNRPPFETPALPRARKIQLLSAMDEGEVKGCVKCELCKTRTNTVFGEGDADARLMFIGEGPGENEDLQGRPFIGRAGELLTKMINGMGLARESVFIVNIVKCRPPNNRVPATDEVEACTPYLERQIEIIRPQVIVTLGLPSTQYVLQTKSAMGKLRGNWHAWRGIKVMPTYHPAYVLRQYTEATRAAVWSDLQQVMKELGLAARVKK